MLPKDIFVRGSMGVVFRGSRKERILQPIRSNVERSGRQTPDRWEDCSKCGPVYINDHIASAPNKLTVEKMILIHQLCKADG